MILWVIMAAHAALVVQLVWIAVEYELEAARTRREDEALRARRAAAAARAKSGELVMPPPPMFLEF